MQFYIVTLALVAAASGQQYVAKTPVVYGNEQNAAILRQASDIAPDGSYTNVFETDNGIQVSESGAPKAVGPEGPVIVSQGQFQYVAPDGTPIQLTFTADENGFQPQGSHLPTPPPIPEEILRSIEYNAAHPQQPEPAYKPQPQLNRYA